MGTDIQFFEDLTVALLAASLGGWLARRAGLNAIVGYIVAGIAIGPFTPGYVAHGEVIGNLAELGLIFLLFSIGLGFSPNDIINAGPRALLAGFGLTIALGAVFWLGASALRFPHPLTLGLIGIVSSTAIAAAFLRDWDVERQAVGQLAIALLVAQDLAAVVLLVIVGAPAGSLSAAGIIVPLVKAIGFVAIALVLGATILHRIVIRLLQRAPTEALVGAFTALALVAAWLAQLSGLSLDFGAFVAGAVISEAAATQMVQGIVAPFRALFVAIFFVSVGMLIDPKLIADHWLAIVVLGAGFAALRFAGWALVGKAGGLPLAGAAVMGVAMVPLGEFNIVLANAASAGSRINASERAVVLGTTLASILLAAVAGPLVKRLPYAQAAEPTDGDAPADATVAIIGFGRVGQTVADTLSRCAIAFSVLENDRNTVLRSRADGIPAVAGDGNDPHALDRIVRPSTRVIVAATPDTATNAAIARRYEQRSDAVIIARATQPQDVAMLVDQGAKNAIVPETEGALSFAAAALRNLGFSDRRVEQEIAAQRTAMVTKAGR